MQKHKEDKENIVSLIGRTFHDSTTTQDKIEQYNPIRADDLDFGNKSLSTSHRQSVQDEELGSVQHFPPFQRPPTRKIGQAMNLEERTLKTSDGEKKPVSTAPVKATQQAIRIRPPSRHKTPSKALGLDLPDKEKEKSESSISFIEDNEPLDPKLKAHFGEDSDPEEMQKKPEAEAMGFDNMFDMSEFLDSDPRAQKDMRPQTREGGRKIQTAMPQSRPIEPMSFEKPAPQKLGPGFDLRLALPVRPKTFIEPDYAQIKPKTAKQESNRGQNKSINSSKVEAGMSKKPSKVEELELSEYLGDFGEFEHFPDPPSSNTKKKAHPQSAKPDAKKSERIMKNNFLDQFSSSYKDEKTNIIFTHSKGSVTNKKSNNISLPFETSLGKDFVGLFAN